MDTRQVSVIARTVYGRTAYYPNNDAARALASIDGAKTLTARHFTAARELGLNIHVADGATVDLWLTLLIEAQK